MLDNSIELTNYQFNAIKFNPDEARNEILMTGCDIINCQVKVETLDNGKAIIWWRTDQSIVEKVLFSLIT